MRRGERSQALIADGSRERNGLLERSTRLRKLALIRNALPSQSKA